MFDKARNLVYILIFTAMAYLYSGCAHGPKKLAPLVDLGHGCKGTLETKVAPEGNNIITQ